MRALLVAALILSPACSSDGETLSDATSLHCPTPGTLPFHLASHGFQDGANKTLATNDPRIKDEASDTIGNPGGLQISIYLPVDQPTAGHATLGYHGVKARTGVSAGLFSTPLPGENVSLWTYDATATMWEQVGRTQTAEDGSYDVTAAAAANGDAVYSMLEGDSTCAEHYTYTLPQGAKFVVTDIDGTLTTSDDELFKQIGDETYVPAMKTAADQMAQAWAMKGYPVIYLTARPHVFRSESRTWLADLGFPTGPLVTAAAVGDAAAYKTAWLERMIVDLGWVPVAAYGNADTDIAAYENAGIPKDKTFIIGPLAGNSGTVAIPNDDYTQHISTFIASVPANN